MFRWGRPNGFAVLLGVVFIPIMAAGAIVGQLTWWLLKLLWWLLVMVPIRTIVAIHNAIHNWRLARAEVRMRDYIDR